MEVIIKKSQHYLKYVLFMAVMFICFFSISCASSSGSADKTVTQKDSNITNTSKASKKNTTLSLAKTELKLVPGQSYWLDSAVTGATWISENENIASVTPDEREHANTYGIITVSKNAEPGQTTTITVKAGGKTKTCTVNVIEDLGVFYSSTFKELCPNHESATTFTVPDGYTTLNYSAFHLLYDENYGYRNTTSLKELNLPDSLMIINSGAISEFKELKRIEIPAGVTTIDSSQTRDCVKLESITIPPSVSNINFYGWFINCPEVKEVTMRDVKVYSTNFSGCPKLTKITLYNSEITTDSFEKAESLETLSIINGKIDAICYSKSIKNLYCAGDVIFNNSFSRCLSLENVVFDCKIDINKDLFSEYGKLQNLTIAAGTIGEEAFYKYPHLTSVTLGDGVTSIGNGAFYKCPKLVSVELGNGLTEIGDYAFESCESFKKIDISESVKWIGRNAFAFCPALESITIPKSTTITDPQFWNCTALKTVEIKGTAEFSEEGAERWSPFHNCTSLEAVVINSVSKKCTMTFEGLPNLRSVKYPQNVTPYSFDGCTSLESVEISPETKIIRRNMFRNCSSLKAIKLPEGLETIDSEAFENCASLVEIDIPSTVTVLYGNVFCGCSSLKSFTIPKGVKDFYPYFKGCDNLENIFVAEGNPFFTSVNGVLYGKSNSWFGNDFGIICYPCGRKGEYTVPDGIKFDPNFAFKNCIGLTKITLNSEENFWSLMFEGCDNLMDIEFKESSYYCTVDGVVYTADKTSIECYPKGRNGKVVIPEGITEIGDEAFSNCKKITEIIIPDTVKTIGTDAFAGCSSIKKITIPDNVKRIKSRAFYNCSSLEEVSIGSGAVGIQYFLFEDCPNLTTITISPKNPDFCVVDGVMFTKDMTTIVACAPGKSGHYTVPNTVKIIDSGAFATCNKLTGITLPEGLEIIASSAFWGWNTLTELTIPKSVMEIGQLGTYHLDRLTVGNSNGWRQYGYRLSTAPELCSDKVINFSNDPEKNVYILNDAVDQGTCIATRQPKFRKDR